jgi:glutathione S-transferase
MHLDPWHVFTADFGSMPKPYTTLVTLIDMALYFLITVNVIRGRIKHKVEPPHLEGPAAFQRIVRVQMNTLEQLALHLPLLWISAFAMDDVFAAAFGIIWTFGRVIYARGYYAKANRRMKGFYITVTINIVLFVGAITGTIASL